MQLEIKNRSNEQKNKTIIIKGGGGLGQLLPFHKEDLCDFQLVDNARPHAFDKIAIEEHYLFQIYVVQDNTRTKV